MTQNRQTKALEHKQQTLFKTSTRGKWFITTYWEDPFTEERAKCVMCIACKKRYFHDGKINKRVKCPECGNRNID